MVDKRYKVDSQTIAAIIEWYRSGVLAIPEIQRPFVWDAAKVRDLIVSMFKGFPIGYIITQANSPAKLKSRTPSEGKTILIDGQQRITGLMSSLYGLEVLNETYKLTRIKIAFNPLEESFEVCNPTIENNSAWIDDLKDVFHPEASIKKIVDGYVETNPNANYGKVTLTLERVRKITNCLVGQIQLPHDMPIETVATIFNLVNSKGVKLRQADFAMSKIAADTDHGGAIMRKAIDYFCHLAVAPDHMATIVAEDKEFANTEYFQQMRWIKNNKGRIYCPTYADMLRVALTTEFRRGKFRDLVAKLSGRNFETRRYEPAVIGDTFDKLQSGIMKFINKMNFERLTRILSSAGFNSRDLIGGHSQNPVNFAYALYLLGRTEGISNEKLEPLVRRWYVMSLITGRYSGSTETAMDRDIGGITEEDPETYCENVINSELSLEFWSLRLPQLMVSSSTTSPYFRIFQAAQVKLNDYGFLTRSNTVLDLLRSDGQAHHIFPKNHLKPSTSKRQINQIANYVITDSVINNEIGDRSPKDYFAMLTRQANGGSKQIGDITSVAKMRENLRMNCLPDSMLDGEIPSYSSFLEERRKLMADRIKVYFGQL